MGQQDENYLDGFLNNNHKIIQSIYDQFFPGILSYVRNNGGSLEDAREVFQDGLIILLRRAKREDFELKSSLFSFIYGICRNLWRNELQRKRRTEVTLTDDHTYISEDQSNEAYLYAERMVLYREKFKELGKRCQEIFRFFQQDRLSFEEIAKKMDYKNEKAAKTAKYKCQQQLIYKIKNDPRFDGLKY